MQADPGDRPMNSLNPALTEADFQAAIAPDKLGHHEEGRGLLLYPEGVSSISPGLRRGTRRYPGSLPMMSYPKGVSSCWCFPGARNATQPRWGSPLNPLTQGRRCANPGLEAATPLGLEPQMSSRVRISASTSVSSSRRDRVTSNHTARRQGSQEKRGLP
jgi:hypothetical protein